MSEFLLEIKSLDYNYRNVDYHYLTSYFWIYIV